MHGLSPFLLLVTPVYSSLNKCRQLAKSKSRIVTPSGIFRQTWQPVLLCQSGCAECNVITSTNVSEDHLPFWEGSRRVPVLRSPSLQLTIPPFGSSWTHGWVQESLVFLPGLGCQWQYNMCDKYVTMFKNTKNTQINTQNN